MFVFEEKKSINTYSRTLRLGSEDFRLAIYLSAARVAKLKRSYPLPASADSGTFEHPRNQRAHTYTRTHASLHAQT
jgi:hypothetical protein